MYCKSCGCEIDDDSVFCSECGEPVDLAPKGKQHTSVKKGGKYQAAKRSSKPKVLIILGIAVFLAVIVFVVFLLIPDPSGVSTDEAIEIVQNGYLGEFTDMTVKEILDSSYMMYEESIWDGGTTDSGSMIVQAKYYDPGDEEGATTIQFTMLNEECFKITAFVDPLNPVEKATDLLATMNYNYLIGLISHNRDLADDPAAVHELITRLNQISGSAVRYGASAGYTGDRAKLCDLDGGTALNVSVAMLLDNYGLLDMSDYYGEETEEAEDFQPVVTEETEATVAEDTYDSEPLALPVDPILLSFARGEQDFIMDGAYINIWGITQIGYYESETVLSPEQFAVVDFDQDGVDEIVIELSDGATAWRIILRSQGSEVYGYGFSFRGLQSISTNGLVMSSQSASESYVSRLHFNGSEISEDHLSEAESAIAFDNWLDVRWYLYSEIYSDVDTSAASSEIYALDYANATTGEVVDSLGTNIIYSGGFSGSQTFYYGDNPDIEFGFVPYDWNNPALTGREEISIIILSGNAKISPYLSAAMNKSQIDAVAWETPNVQNVTSEYAHSDMDGNIYRYEIETVDARVLYTWYLDNGDSIEYAASFVCVCPK